MCGRAALNTRYFYESFTDTDELLGAVYNDVVEDLVGALAKAMSDQPDDRARLAAGIRTVLDFSSADPRRGKILFTEARTNPVLVERRSAIQEQLRRSVLDDRRTTPAPPRTANLVGAAMHTGAMAELAHQWLAGNLGRDLDTVVDFAVRVMMPAGGGTDLRPPDSPRG